MHKILLIYNNTSNIEELNIVLTNSGYNTYLAEDINNGLEIAKIYLPELILCNISNNGISGVELVKKLQDNDRTKIIPLVYISSNPDLTEMRQIMNAGADDYISFPIIENELVGAINVRLEKFNSVKIRYDKLQKETIEASGELPVNDRHVLVKIGTKLRIIKFENIVCITASKEYSKITTSDPKKYIIRKSLKKWMEILPNETFLQIHRATIINVEFIDKMNQAADGLNTVFLKNCKEVFHISVRNAKKIKKRFIT